MPHIFFGPENPHAVDCRARRDQHGEEEEASEAENEDRLEAGGELHQKEESSPDDVKARRGREP
jgi:hypothetical protein